MQGRIVIRSHSPVEDDWHDLDGLRGDAVAERPSREAGSAQQPAARISVDDLVEATTAGVMRALDARRQPAGPDIPGIRGPILWGIIWWPNAPEGPIVASPTDAPAPRVSGTE